MKTTAKPIIHIEAGGQQRPVRFGFAALMDFCEAAGLSLADLQGLDLSTLGLKDLCHLYWAGFKDGARKEKEDFDSDVYDVADWMDEFGDDEQAQIMELFAAAQGASGDAGEGAEGKPKPKKKAA